MCEWKAQRGECPQQSSQGLISAIQIVVMNLSCHWVEREGSEVRAGLMHTKQEQTISCILGILSVYSSMHYLQADALWTNSKNCRPFVSPLPEWKLLQSTAGVPRHASAQNKWRQKLSAINTYGRPKTRSNYQRSAWSISDHYSVISVGGCKVVLTPLVIDRMDSLWAEFQLAHKRKSYFSWQVEEFQSDSSRSCLLLVRTSPVP